MRNSSPWAGHLSTSSFNQLLPVHMCECYWTPEVPQPRSAWEEHQWLHCLEAELKYLEFPVPHPGGLRGSKEHIRAGMERNSPSVSKPSSQRWVLPCGQLQAALLAFTDPPAVKAGAKATSLACPSPRAVSSLALVPFSVLWSLEGLSTGRLTSLCSTC